MKCCINTAFPSFKRGVSQTAYVWPKNDLRVSFLNGSAGLQGLVIAIASEIQRYCNIRFHWWSSTSDIRITFDEGGSWSYLGTVANHIPRNKPTMNFGWLTDDMTQDDPTARAVIFHEFGHALSLRHEHLHPLGGIPWNRPVLYRELGKLGWTRDQVDMTYLNPIAADKVLATDFDTDSVMIYPIPQEWTIGDFEVPWRTELSVGDQEILHKLYPFPNQVYLPQVLS